MTMNYLEKTELLSVLQQKVDQADEQFNNGKYYDILTSMKDLVDIVSQMPGIDAIPVEDVGTLLRNQPYVKVEPYQWIPVTFYKPTKEELEEFKDGLFEFDMPDDEVFLCNSPMPDDGDAILISQYGKYVDTTVFERDWNGGIGDEDGNDWLTEVDAWMPMPKPYKKDGA